MISGKSADRLELDATRGDSQSQPHSGRISVRFRRGPVIAIVAGALLWAGIIAAWRLL